MYIEKIRQFIKLETSSGILLALAAVFAIILQNSPLGHVFESILHTPISISFTSIYVEFSLIHGINDGLMTLFFLLVGLEIKREIVKGELSSKEKLLLPMAAAFGGVIAPAIIYSVINWGDAQNMKGWAIPAATDIAFALGVLLLLGKRIPESLKICLVAIAIIDDIIAILVIALFYTEQLSIPFLFYSLAAIMVLFALNQKRVMNLVPYILVGFILWLCVLKSGIHSTLSGVILAVFIPIHSKNNHINPPLIHLEHALHPWVAFCILPIFAFTNAGVSLQGMSIPLLLENIPLGIMMGLFFGKQIGVMLVSYVLVNFNICKLPSRVTWFQYYGMALLTGIGFTMSLFIGSLAFPFEYQNSVRLGVIIGSCLSGLSGYILLRLSTKNT